MTNHADPDDAPPQRPRTTPDLAQAVRAGEFLLRGARAHGVQVTRGSARRTGKESAAALTEGVDDSLSPMRYGDDPRGWPVGELEGPQRVETMATEAMATEAGQCPHALTQMANDGYQTQESAA